MPGRCPQAHRSPALTKTLLASSVTLAAAPGHWRARLAPSPNGSASANRVVADKQMDLVMIGRAHLANPHWSYQAALQLKKEKASWVLPAPYAHWLERYQPTQPARARTAPRSRSRPARGSAGG